MPDRDATERHSTRQLTAMIWAGLGLVPVAVLIVLAGSGDRSLRFAVLLVAVSVVLVGASLLIRNDPELLRMDVADRVADETGTLREELRGEVAAAARATHHRVQALQDEVARLHRERTPSRPLAGPIAVPAGVERGREVAGPGQSVPVRGRVPAARAAATVRPVGDGAATAAAVAPVNRTVDGPPGPVITGSAGRRARSDDVRRPRRAERRGHRSAGPDVEGADAAPSAWLAEPDSGWLIRPGEDTGSAPESGPDDRRPYEREPSRRHRSADAYEAGRSGIRSAGYGAEPGRRRRRAAEETDDRW